MSQQTPHDGQPPLVQPPSQQYDQPSQQQYNQQWQQPYLQSPPNTYYPPQQWQQLPVMPSPLPPKKKPNPWLILGIIVVIVVIGGAIINSFSSSPESSPTPTPVVSLTDQVSQALKDWPDTGRLVLSTASDAVEVQLSATGDAAGEAETIAQAVNISSGYQKSIWQANIAGLSEVTVVITQTDYPGGTNPQDIAKCVVTQATGTSLDWSSGTPAELFQRFDVHWTIGQGQEP